MERFGKVYMKSDTGENKNENEDQKWEILRTATFSNIDLFWYSLDGEIHSKLAKYRGQPFHLGFNIPCTGINGKSILYHGKLLCPIRLGEERGDFDIENLDQAYEDSVDMAIKLNLIKDRDDPKVNIMKNGDFAMSRLLASPGFKLKDLNLLSYVTAFVVADDILDNQEVRKTGNSGVLNSVLNEGKLTYRQLARLTVDMMCEPLRGNYVGLSEMLSAVPPCLGMQTGFKQTKEIHGYFHAAQEGFFGFRDEALKLAGGSEEKIRPMLQAVINWLEATCLDGSKEAKEMRSEGFCEGWMELELDLHRFTVGAPMFIEVPAVERQIFIEKRIRDSFIFRRYFELACAHFSYVNNIMSYQKEIDHEDARTNEIYLLQLHKGMSLEKALDTVVERTNHTLKMILLIGEILVKIFGDEEDQIENEADGTLIENHDLKMKRRNDKGIAGYVETLKDTLCGHIQYCAYTVRYHKNVVLDCYVGE